MLVTLTVGIIFTGALLGPVINDVSETEKTFDNTPYGYYTMKVLENGDTWTFSDSKWTYNGDLIPTASNTGVSVVVTNNTTIRQDGICRGTTYGNNLTNNATVSIADDTNKLIVNSTNNITYTTGYGAVPEGGDYVLKTYENKAYVKGDTLLWVTGYTALTSTSTSQLMVHVEGTLNDGLTITVAPKQGGTTTDISVGDYTIAYEAVDGYEDLYRIQKVSFNVTGTFNEEVVTKEFNYSTFVVPTTVTAELSQHLDAGEIAILAAIPLMAIAALVLLVVRYFVAGRD